MIINYLVKNMKKGFSLIFLLVIVLTVGVGAFTTVKFFAGAGRPTTDITPTPGVEQGATVRPTEQQKQQVSSVPLPTEEDIIRTFFNLINEKRIPEAIAMMNNNAVGDDSTKQTWGVHFDAIKSINVMSIEPSMKESWSQDKHSYKVTLEAYVSSEAANAPIPYYGWGDNPNIRWITLIKEGDFWKIAELATGP